MGKYDNRREEALAFKKSVEELTDYKVSVEAGSFPKVEMTGTKLGRTINWKNDGGAKWSAWVPRNQEEYQYRDNNAATDYPNRIGVVTKKKVEAWIAALTEEVAARKAFTEEKTAAVEAFVKQFSPEQAAKLKGKRSLEIHGKSDLTFRAEISSNGYCSQRVYSYGGSSLRDIPGKTSFETFKAINALYE